MDYQVFIFVLNLELKGLLVLLHSSRPPSRLKMYFVIQQSFTYTFVLTAKYLFSPNFNNNFLFSEIEMVYLFPNKIGEFFVIFTF